MKNVAITSESSILTNEIKRLDAVKRYINFQKWREKDLQDIVMLASHICDSPMVLVTLMDDKTQWIKAKIGVDVYQMPVSTSFCVHAIKQDQVVVVEDALLDDRFSDLPAVVGNPNIRFYASAILKSHDGHNVGTLCIYDIKPKALSQVQINCLESLGKQVSHLMELDLSLAQLQNHINEIKNQSQLIKNTKNMLKAAWDSSISYHLLVGTDLSILAINKKASMFFKQTWGKYFTVNHSITEYGTPETIQKFLANFYKALKGETVKIERLINYDKTKPHTWWEVVYAPACDEENNIIGVTFNATDINERKINEDKISAQNQRLTKISQIQSHEYRAPVSAILGIMSIIKEEDYKPNKEYLLLLEQAVKQLDEKINSVVNYTNQL
ncbi:MAG: hypothetical protein JWN56_2097 [Sphingobacteriales bacterium]|nr:hypothetical protein [Sphingobacteriales bacterium]